MVKDNKEGEEEKGGEGRRKMKTALWLPGKNPKSLKKRRELGWYQTCQLLHTKHDHNGTIFLRNFREV